MSNEPMRQFLECRRCHYGAGGDWRRRVKGRLPKQCPKCKSYHWNEDVVRPRGRPPKAAETVNAEMVEEVVTEAPLVILAEEMLKEQFIGKWPEAESDHGAGCSCTNCLWERGAL